MSRLHVACVVDADILASVRRGRVTSTRTRYDVSMVETLRRLYRRVDVVGAAEDLDRTVDELRRLRPDVVFSLAYSATPREAAFAEALQWLDVPYTGSAARAIRLTNDKMRARRVLAQVGVRVPRWNEFRTGARISVALAPPLIIKPARGASSVGINRDSVILDPAEVAPLVRRVWRTHDARAICEEFIVGRDLKVGLVETADHDFRVSGISEWTFGAVAPGWGFRTYALKTNPELCRRHRVERTRASLSRPLLQRVAATSATAARALGVQGYGGVDMRMDRRGELVVLEVNSNPGLFSGAPTFSQPRFDRNIRDIVRAALFEKL